MSAAVAGADPRTTALLRVALQLTGDPDRALTMAVRALARLPRRGRRSDSALDRAATSRLVRDRSVSRARAAVVLAFGLGWDAETIAEVSRRTAGGVRRDVGLALAVQSEEAWRAELQQAAAVASWPADLEERVRTERLARRRRLRTQRLAAAALATAGLGVVVAVVRVVTAPPPLPATAHSADLLAWPPRGDLVRDSAVREAAVTTWRSDRDPPQGRVYVLYAGRVDGRAVVVMQGHRAGRPTIAVATHGDTAGRMVLTGVARLGTPKPPVIAVTTLGSVGVPVTRLLASPDVVRVTERSVQGGVPQQRPAYVPRSLHDGLSQPWVTAARGGPLTALRVTGADGTSYLGLLDGSDLQPVVARPILAPPPARWTGLPARFSPLALTDDGVWFAQLCRDPSPLVQLTWVGRAPGFPSPLRVERVGCAGVTTASFLTGVGDHAVTLAGNREGTEPRRAYAAVLTPPTLGHAYVVVVGSRRVADITVGTDRRLTRVAVVPLERAGDIRVHADDGTLIELR
jgi:hypothetical protein